MWGRVYHAHEQQSAHTLSHLPSIAVSVKRVSLQSYHPQSHLPSTVTPAFHSHTYHPQSHLLSHLPSTVTPTIHILNPRCRAYPPTVSVHIFFYTCLCIILCYFTGLFYVVISQISMLFIDNKNSVFCKSDYTETAGCRDQGER